MLLHLHLLFLLLHLCFALLCYIKSPYYNILKKKKKEEEDLASLAQRVVLNGLHRVRNAQGFALSVRVCWGWVAERD